jgi:hypothetical protein
MEKEVWKVYRQSLEVGLAGANQTAMLEVFGSSKTMFAQMIAVDVLVANMDGIPSMGPKEDRIDKWLKADNTPNYSTRESTRGRTS